MNKNILYPYIHRSIDYEIKIAEVFEEKRQKNPAIRNKSSFDLDG